MVKAAVKTFLIFHTIPNAISWSLFKIPAPRFSHMDTAIDYCIVAGAIEDESTVCPKSLALAADKLVQRLINIS